MNSQNFGPYQLLKKLATGGMAEVWLARETGIEGFQRLMVVKRILPHLADDPEFVQMFLNEAKIAARFTHPNIAQIYNLGETNGTYFIAMEFVHGEDLGRVMRKAWSTGQWIARPLSIRIVASACEGLNYAHNKTDESGRPLKVVHRDISPQNILISFDGSVKLVDFGIAKAADQASMTKSGAIKGKFAYMSPEQAAGKALDHRSDIFAIGLVLYELLTGVRPLKRDSELATLQAALECKIEAPSQVADVPRELDDVVMRALAKAADDRYRDARAFQMALEETLVAQRWVASSVQISELMGTLFADRLSEEAKLGHPDPEGQDSKSGTPMAPQPPDLATEKASKGGARSQEWEAPPGQSDARPRAGRASAHSKSPLPPRSPVRARPSQAREGLTAHTQTEVPDAPSWDAPEGALDEPRRSGTNAPRRADPADSTALARTPSRSDLRRSNSGEAPRGPDTGDQAAWQDDGEEPAPAANGNGAARQMPTREAPQTRTQQGDGLPPIRSKSVTKVPVARSRSDLPRRSSREELDAQEPYQEEAPPSEGEGLEPFEPELPPARPTRHPSQPSVKAQVAPAPRRAPTPAKPRPIADELDLDKVVDPFEQRKERLQLMRRLGMVAGVSLVVILGLTFWRPIWDVLSSTANDGQAIYLTVETNEPVTVLVLHHPDEGKRQPTVLGTAPPMQKVAGAHIRDTIVLENRKLGIHYEEPIPFGEPGEVKRISKRFESGRLRLKLKPSNLSGLQIYSNDEQVGQYIPDMSIELVEGEHELELRGPMLREPVKLKAKVRAGVTTTADLLDLSPMLAANGP